MAACRLCWSSTAVEYIIAFIPGEVHIDIGRVGAAWIQEALEIEVVLDGADIGDSQAVGHQGGGPRTATACSRGLRWTISRTVKK